LIGGIILSNRDNGDDHNDHLQDQINHTFENLRDAENYLDEHADDISDDEKDNIESKNDRRKESINDLKAAKRDEARQ